MDSVGPLTKAKLFALQETEQWTEIGVGVVSIVTELVPASFGDGGHPSSGGSGKRGKAGGDEEAGTRVKARIQIASIDSPNDLLFTSYVSLENKYAVQGDSILVWYEDAVGKEIACSFSSKDGCDLIFQQIRTFQLRQDDRLPALVDRFAVQQRNLTSILDAAEMQNKRFGIYVRDSKLYFNKLAELFRESQAKGDTATMELVARIVLALLQPPYSSEGKIIAQFVENECIDVCIDIVQYALGRRDKASGFVSFEERRATFHDPCNLPESIKSRIHVLYSCGFLKDLIPLSLEPADAASYSLLSSFTLRFTAVMLTELCASPTILPRAFQQATEAVRLDSAAADPASIEPSKVAHLFELAAFTGEIAKTVKNAMIGIDMRTEIFSSLVHVGLLPFLTTVLECALRYYDPPATYGVQQWVVQPPRAVQLVCDTLYSCATHFPECLEDLVAESHAMPQRCLLQLLLRTVTVVRTSAEAQSVVDAVQCCGVGVPLTLAMFGDNAQLEARRHEVLRYWIEGNVVDRPPLFHLAAYLVSALTATPATDAQPAQLLHSSTTISGSFFCSAAASPAQLSVVTERQVVYSLRLITAILAKIDATRCASFTEVLTLSKLIPALAGTLAQPQRRLANLQSSVTAFIAAALERREARLVALVASSDASVNLLHAALQLFLQCSHRDNILRSSLAHLLSVVCEGVHREKVCHSGTAFSNGSGSSIGPSPFVTAVPTEDSISKAEQNTATPTVPARPFESVAGAVLTQFGERLAVAAPVLHRQLLKALEETPDEAQQAEMETSSIASSMERSAMSNFADFDAAAIDFGLEPPLRTPALDAVTEERLSSLTRSLTASDDDEDPLADLSSIESDSDPGEADEEATAEAPLSEAAKTQQPGAGARGGGGGAVSSPPIAPVSAGGAYANGSVHPTLPLASTSSLSPMAGLESIDLPTGRGSLLEDEENRLPKRRSMKRTRGGNGEVDNEEEEEDDAEVKRMKAEDAAA